MQGGHPARPVVGVGALIEQEAGELGPARDDRERQDVRAVAPGRVDVDPGRDEGAAYRDVAVAGREHQRREAGGGLEGGVRAPCEQQAHDVVMGRREPPHQRGAPGLGGDRVHVGAVVEERPDDRGVTGARGGHQGRQPARPGRAGVGAALQQPLDHRGAGVLGRPLQRRHPVVVGRVGVRSRLQEPLGEGEVVPVRGPDQGRGAVGAARVHVSALGEPRLDRARILRRHRVDQTQVLPRGVGRRAGDNGQGHQADDDGAHSCLLRFVPVRGNHAPYYAVRPPRAARPPPGLAAIRPQPGRTSPASRRRPCE